MRWSAGTAPRGHRGKAQEKPKFIRLMDPGDRRHGIHAGPRGKGTRVVRRQKTRMRGTLMSWPFLGIPLARQGRAGSAV